MILIAFLIAAFGLNVFRRCLLDMDTPKIIPDLISHSSDSCSENVFVLSYTRMLVMLMKKDCFSRKLTSLFEQSSHALLSNSKGSVTCSHIQDKFTELISEGTILSAVKCFHRQSSGLEEETRSLQTSVCSCCCQGIIVPIVGGGGGV